MTRRIAINGFGRIGRGVLRAIVSQQLPVEVVAINDLTDTGTLAHLYNFDSVYGRSHPKAEITGEELTVDGHTIAMLSEPEPAQLPWESLGVDVVFEATGRFTDAEKAADHLSAGAKRVLVSAPSSGADVTLVRGVNWGAYDSEKHKIISNGSCSTNALAPLVKVLNDTLGIEHGLMTTVHAYTGDQRLVDSPHKDLRRARAAGLNIVPTSTGAARAISKVLPELEGKLDGAALRVPVPVGSIVEVVARVSKQGSVEELHEAYREAATGSMRGVLDFSADPLVSTDIVGQKASSIFDSGLTMFMDDLVKVTSWYDNEYAFSHRAAETLAFLTE